MFSPPHTAVQVHGERVANGFTLEIDDRGPGHGARRCCSTPTCGSPRRPSSSSPTPTGSACSWSAGSPSARTSRVSLQPSPYGGTTAVVFIPATLLTDAPDTEGTGFRLDRTSARGDGKNVPDAPRRALSPLPVGIPGRVGPGRPGRTGAAARPVGPGGALRSASARRARTRSRRPAADSLPLRPPGPRAGRTTASSTSRPPTRDEEQGRVPLPRRHRVPTLVSDNGRRGGRPRARPPGPRPDPDPWSRAAPSEGDRLARTP